MPLMRVIWSPDKPCSMPAITGTPPATAAPCINCTPCFSASRASAAPRYAISCLFAVTTDLPAAKHLRSHFSAGSSPPINSTTMSASRVQNVVEVLRPHHRCGHVLRSVRRPLPCDIAVEDMRQLHARKLRRRQHASPPSCRPCQSPAARSSPVRRGYGFLEAALFGRGVLRLIAMSVFDLIGLAPATC